MRAPFALTHALREARSTARRLALYGGAIAIGVAAVVAINSFRAAVTDTARADAARLLGADLLVSSNQAFPEPVSAVLDSAAAAGVPVARLTGTVSVALAPGTDRTRLVRLNAVEPGYPWYGTTETEPAGLWPTLHEAGVALVERAVLTALGIEAGDSIRLGAASFIVAGVLTNPPPELGFRSAMGPRVWIPAARLDETRLIRFGSILEYEAYLALPDASELERFLDQNREAFRELGVRARTAQEQGEDLAEALGTFGRFLGLVGMAALMLGGLGVAGAVHVFVREKRATIAMLRCLGATQRTAFATYLIQATLLGLAGAAMGAVAGIAVQATLPPLLGPVFPFEIPFTVRWTTILAGLAIGTGVAIVFSLLPLLEIRGIPPLRALRAQVEPPRRRADPLRFGAWLLIGATIIALAVTQAGMLLPGLAFAGGLLGTLLLLRIAAGLLMRSVRRAFPRTTVFAVRQGVSNLFRPGNQTSSVVVTLGFAVFVLATLMFVQRSVLAWIDGAGGGDAPGMVAFDIQTDQRESVLSLIRAAGGTVHEAVPLVPARIAAIGSVRAEALLSSPRVRDIEPWAVRREYRHTWRATTTSAEQIVAGDWWPDAPPAPTGYARISVEADLADGLGVTTGDTIVWDVQGVEIPSIVSSLRSVEWGQFRTNFFVVFEPGALDAAPQTWVVLADAADAAGRASLQAEIVRGHGNVSVLDVASAQEAITRIIARVATAIRFIAGFSLAAGVLVLIGAVTTSRFQRARESALLRAIGARHRQIRGMLLTEYLALGALAGFAGLALATIAAWLVVERFLDLDFVLPAVWLVVGWAAIALLAAAAGLANSREVLRGSPLSAIRGTE